MKLAEIDWGEVLGALPRWEALPPAARGAFLQIKPGTATHADVLGGARDELVAAGFVSPPGPKGMLYPHDPGLRLLLVALRATDRLRPLDGRDGTLPELYIQDQLTTAETNAFTETKPYHYYVDRQGAAARVSSVEWLKGFLAARPGMPMVQWEQACIPPGEQQRLVSPRVAEAARRLVQALAERPAGVPLGSL